ncbi:Fe-S cluster assembly protein SufD [bacterium]|nr:Fe-S cluster assembly protein SufD [bacterium]
MTPKEYKDQLIGQYTEFKAAQNGRANSDFQKQGEQFAQSLGQLDFPTKRHEEWKYTTLDRVLKKWPKPVFKSAPIDHFWLAQNGISGIQTVKVILANGILDRFDKLPAGVTLEAYSLGNQVEVAPTDATDIFENINRAFAVDSIKIKVAANTVVPIPIKIVNVLDATHEAVFAQRNVEIEVGKNAEVTFIERQITKGPNTSLANGLTHIKVDNNAQVKHLVLQNDGDNASQVNRTYVDQNRDSVYSNYVFSLSGEVIRNNLRISLNAENTVGNMYGLYLLDGKEHVDNHTVVDHRLPNCESNELYKGVLNGYSTGVFNGKIFVRQDAQKTNAYQQNRNLLISDHATINTKPQLEIWADDVKCSHGCTVGQLDEEQLFYLRSRGIDTNSARALMIYAFASEIVEKQPVEALKEYLFNAISKKLAFNLE